MGVPRARIYVCCEHVRVLCCRPRVASASSAVVPAASLSRRPLQLLLLVCGAGVGLYLGRGWGEGGRGGQGVGQSRKGPRVLRTVMCSRGGRVRWLPLHACLPCSLAQQQQLPTPSAAARTGSASGPGV